MFYAYWGDKENVEYLYTVGGGIKVDITVLKKKAKEKIAKEKIVKAVDFTRNNWKKGLLLLGVAVVGAYLSSQESDDENATDDYGYDDDSLSYGEGGNILGGKKRRATVAELREMSDLSDKLKDYDATIFTDMLTSFESGRMTMNDIRNKATRSLEKVNYYDAPKCAGGCGGYPDSCMGCNLGDNR